MPLLWESEISQLVFLFKEALDVLLVTDMSSTPSTFRQCKEWGTNSGRCSLPLKSVIILLSMRALLHQWVMSSDHITVSSFLNREPVALVLSFHEVSCLLEEWYSSLTMSVLPSDVLLLLFSYPISRLAISYFLENQILGLDKSSKLCNVRRHIEVEVFFLENEINCERDVKAVFWVSIWTWLWEIVYGNIKWYLQ